MNTEETAMQARLDSIAMAITAAHGLGDGWAVKPAPPPDFHWNARAELTGPEGAEIDLSTETVRFGEPRLVIQAELNGLHNFMRYDDRDVKRRITVALDTDPAKIVSAINRRLLPGYLDVLRRAQVEKAAHDDRAARVAATAMMIVERFSAYGARIWDQKQTYPGDTVHFRGLPTVTVQSDGDVAFGYCRPVFDCSAEKALRILEILAEGIEPVTLEE